jgi:hypothetical protein
VWLLTFLLPLQTLTPLLTETNDLTLLRIAKAQPVEPLIAAA